MNEPLGWSLVQTLPRSDARQYFNLKIGLSVRLVFRIFGREIKISQVRQLFAHFRKRNH